MLGPPKIMFLHSYSYYDKSSKSLQTTRSVWCTRELKVFVKGLKSRTKLEYDGLDDHTCWNQTAHGFWLGTGKPCGDESH